MDVLFLVLCTLTLSSINIFSSLFISKNKINKNGAIFFNLIMCITPLIGWGIYYAIEQGFDPSVLFFSLGYGFCFVFAFVFLTLAIQNGPLSFTSLLVQLSLVITAIWGIVFWNTPMSVYTILGLVFIIISLCLIIIKKERKNISIKWIVFSLLSCAANAAATILIKTQQMQYENKYGGEMMFFGFIVAIVLSSILFIVFRKKIVLSNAKGTWYFCALAGIGNFLTNMLIIFMARTTLSPAIIYPTLAVVSLAINIVFSLFYNKEKITIIQGIGLVIGAVAILFLSL